MLNWIKLSTFTKVPGNLSLGLVTVLNPPEAELIVAIPILDAVAWITSALKIDDNPTVPEYGVAPTSLVLNMDFMSEIPWAVTAIAIFPLKIPLTIIGSFLMKSPEVSYTSKLALSVIGLNKNPVAPLLAPFMWVGVVSVLCWFRVIWVVVCTSYREISHSFNTELLL